MNILPLFGVLKLLVESIPEAVLEAFFEDLACEVFLIAFASSMPHLLAELWMVEQLLYSVCQLLYVLPFADETCLPINDDVWYSTLICRDNR